jgi:hypothetical protein
MTQNFRNYSKQTNLVKRILSSAYTDLYPKPDSIYDSDYEPFKERICRSRSFMMDLLIQKKSSLSFYI